MPIYMDRHFVEDGTRHAIANAHERDLQVQDKHDVKFLTYWFDEQRSTTFCLVNAPDKAAIQSAHDEAHGSVPHEIIEVDPSLVASFLGRVEDPPTQSADDKPPVDSAFRAIMFTDLKDSTLMTTIHGDVKALHLLHIHNALTRNALRKFSGNEVKHTGDGIMASFQSVPQAVQCSLEIRNGFNDHNYANPEEALYVRIGLSAGEPIEEHGDLFGNAVQTAARLCALAEPNRIMASEVVKNACPDLRQLFTDAGEKNLKGLEEGLTVYRIDL